MARVTVYLSDELSERLNRYRDKLNISGICSTAIEKEIRILEDLPEDRKDMDEIVAQVRERILRLREDKRKEERVWFKKGYEAGLKWAREEADYEGLRKYGEGMPVVEHGTSGAKRTRYIRSREEIMVRKAAGDCPSDMLVYYEEGWMKGVQAVWELVKDKL